MRLDRRPRRLRRTPALRALVRETDLAPHHLVWPCFVRAGRGVREPLASLPGCWRYSPDELAAAAGAVAARGVPAVLLFGQGAEKDDSGAAASADRGPVQEAVRALKDAAPELVVITDVCLCAYTSHGHCGLVVGERINNDLTVDRLVEVALSHAQAGADFVAPSDMMDGRVGAIRRALDENAFEEVGILAYAAKYASAFYGPFREAAGSTPAFGDRKTYQMDAANRREARREIALDLEEGADIVMIKPALACLDVIREARERFDAPLAAYSVSGEYALVAAGAQAGWLDEREAALEILTAIRRAGADLIVTYWADRAAAWLGG